jgi:hypothetical protein
MRCGRRRAASSRDDAGLRGNGLRSELRRLFRWLKDKGGTAIITCERDGSGLTRRGLEEYVSDCVIMLDHRVTDQLSTRRNGRHRQAWLKKGMLRIDATRPTAYGLETHLAALHELVSEFEPRVVIVDPIANFLKAGTQAEAEGMSRLPSKPGGSTIRWWNGRRDPGQRK